MLPTPRHYQIIDAISRAGSIRKAAEKLSVASSAVNRMLLEIEGLVGTPLFERLPRGVRLTAAGEVLVAAIRRNLAEMRSAASQIEQLRGLVRGYVRIGCGESVANDLIPWTTADYQRAHPGVQFQVLMGVTAEMVAKLENDDVDLVLVHDPDPSEALKPLASLNQRLCAMMRPDHPLADRQELRLADCQRHPVALSAESYRSRKMIDAAALRSRIRLDVRLESNNVQTIKEFTLASNAISFQFQLGTLREVQRGEFVAIPLKDPGLDHRKIVLACRSGRLLPVPVQSFADKIAVALREASRTAS